MFGFISYWRGAHSLGKKPTDKIISECMQFLQTFTNNDGADHIILTFHGSEHGTYKSLPSVWKLSKRFGIPSLGTWPYKGRKVRNYSWNLRTTKDVDDGLQLLETFAGFPPNNPSPLVLSFMWRFYFGPLSPVCRLNAQTRAGGNGSIQRTEIGYPEAWT